MPVNCLVSVLLVTYNHENSVGRALASIAAQQTEFDVEIVVADDASTGGTLKEVESGRDRFSRMRFLSTENNLGTTYNLRACFRSTQRRRGDRSCGR